MRVQLGYKYESRFGWSTITHTEPAIFTDVPFRSIGSVLRNGPPVEGVDRLLEVAHDYNAARPAEWDEVNARIEVEWVVR